MTVNIAPANLRDASYVTAHLRPLDRQEAYCQLPFDDLPTAVLAHGLLHAGDAFVAYLDAAPVALFGTAPITSTCYGVFMVGTADCRNAIPAISRFFMVKHVEKRIAEGALTMEARSLETHHGAHRWMRSLGAEQVTPEPFPFGRGGERFLLFRWTVAGYRAIREKRWFQNPQGRPR